MNVTPERDSVWTALTVPSTVTVSPTCFAASAAAMIVSARADVAARASPRAKTSARMVLLRIGGDHSKRAQRGLRSLLVGAILMGFALLRPSCGLAFRIHPHDAPAGLSATDCRATRNTLSETAPCPTP